MFPTERRDIRESEFEGTVSQSQDRWFTSFCGEMTKRFLWDVGKDRELVAWRLFPLIEATFFLTSHGSSVGSLATRVH